MYQTAEYAIDEPEEPHSIKSLSLFFFLPVFGNVINPTLIALLVLILILIACSALISGSEVAYFGFKEDDLNRLKDQDSASTHRILRLLRSENYLLSTILVANNFINIGLVLSIAFALSIVFQPLALPAWAILLIEVVLVTFLLVLFGEVTPKIYANINRESLARMMSRPLLILRTIFYPVNLIMVEATKIIERKLISNGTNTMVSIEEIDQAIDLTIKDETQSEDEADLLKRVIKFPEESVTQVMCSRVEIVAIDYETTFDEVLILARESEYSRIPVYKENLDHIKGILYVKDLLPFLEEDALFPWQEHLREVLVVPEYQKLGSLLTKFKSERKHIAIVVNEFGGTEGLVTLEDVMEEITGEIQDEFDEASDINYRKINDSTFDFDGRTLINDVCRVIGVDTSTFDREKGLTESVAGILLEKSGVLPEIGFNVTYNDFRFTAVAVDDRRIITVRVKNLPQRKL